MPKEFSKQVTLSKEKISCPILMTFHKISLLIETFQLMILCFSLLNSGLEQFKMAKELNVAQF